MWWLVLFLTAFAASVGLAVTRATRSRRALTTVAPAPPSPFPALGSPSSLESPDEDDVTLVGAIDFSALDKLCGPKSNSSTRPAATLLAEMIQEAQSGADAVDVGIPVTMTDGESRVILLCEDDAADDEPTGPGARIAISARADSDQGRRRKRNEDSFLMLEEHALFAVADGMGGYEGGEVASNLAVNALRAAFTRAELTAALPPATALPRRAGEIAAAVLEANLAIFEAARAEPALAEMGTTVVAARFAVDKQRLYIGHVGDSRCYRLRERRLDLLTTDHTMRQLGMLGPHENHLSRALGLDRNVDIDVVVDKPRPQDLYLLCTDGLTKMVSDARILEVLLTEQDLESAVYALIEQANDAGGKDNVTVVLVRVEASKRNVRAKGSRQGWQA